MNFFNFGKLGRTLVLAGVVAVSAVCWVGCGGDDNPSGGDNNGGNTNNSGNNNNGGGGSSETVSLGGLKWMKKNLNVQAADSWCYGNADSNCVKYGRLYTWEAAKSACQSVGMRLPSREEWGALAKAAGGTGDYGVGGTAGKALKSTSGWNHNGNGIDKYGFSALPGGSRTSDGSFYGAGRYGGWWTATGNGGSYAYYRDMYYYDDYVAEYGYDDKSYGYSVRCVKD